jgi:hypothetical protein
VLALCLALGLLAPTALVAAATIDYKSESEATFAQQLAKREVASVTVNKRLRTLRVTLKDGTHVLARYPKRAEPSTVARLRANGVSVTVLTGSQAAKQQPKQSAHHKIRYIAGGVVIVVIVIVGLVLLLNRRRERD